MAHRWVVKEGPLYLAITDRKRGLAMPVSTLKEATKFDSLSEAAFVMRENGGPPTEDAKSARVVALRKKLKPGDPVPVDRMLDPKVLEAHLKTAMRRGGNRPFGFLSIFIGLVVEDLETRLEKANRPLVHECPLPKGHEGPCP